jgi:hypothetical protein
MIEDELLNPMGYHVDVPMSTNLHDLRYYLYRPSRLDQNVIYLIGSILRSFDIRNTVRTAILNRRHRLILLGSLIEDGLYRYGYKLVPHKYMRKLGFSMDIV